MVFRKENLDLILVPSGLIIMFAYHLFLLHRYFHKPHTTQMGFENKHKSAWVASIMKDKEKNVSYALTVTGSNTTAAISLAIISLTLCSLIGAWIANSSNNFFQSEIIYGDTRPGAISVKFMSLFICFLLAFSCFVQSARNFVHADYLISNLSNDVPLDVVESAVIRGGECWSLGLRALHFALILLLWFFGPITMFVSSIVIVVILSYLDYNSTHLLPHESAGSQMVETTGRRYA